MKTQEEYLDEYISMMEVALARPTPEGYTERHHILPKSWMPNDYIVVLTAQEHFMAHYLLSMAFPEDESMTYAFWAMCNQKNSDQERDYVVESEVYAEAKQAFSKVHSANLTGRKHTIKALAKMSVSQKGRKHSADTREKIRNCQLGRKHSLEHRNKVSSALTGRKLSADHIAKMSAAMEGNNNPMSNPKWQVTCQHCDKTMNKGGYVRYHGDKCKLK